MIGKSRMKGEKVITCLVPYGPEIPQSGMVKSVDTHHAEIFWDPPKGDFTKYTLTIDSIEEDESRASVGDLLRVVSRSDSKDGSHDKIPVPTRKIENLSHKLNTYTIMGLEPGDKYEIQLGTKTGEVESRQKISDIILTKPERPEGAMITNITSTSCDVQWLLPDKHPSLRGFQLKVRKFNTTKIVKNISVIKTENNFNLFGLLSGTDFDLSLTALCSYNDKQTESEPTNISLVTPPVAPINLTQDNSSPSSITVSWDTPPSSYATLKYKVSINNEENKLSTRDGNNER